MGRIPRAAEEPRRDVARSVELFRAFLAEPSEPVRAYSVLAADTTRLVSRHLNLQGTVGVDIGGGPGYTAEAFRAAGCAMTTVDLHPDELRLHGRPAVHGLVADGMHLPFADSVLDLCTSLNTLEHVPEPWRFLDELVRVVRPGGVVFLSFTNWLSPWGGHETSPWHYLGGRRAARRYQARTGHPPKNRYGSSLFRVGIGETVSRVREHPQLAVLDAYPRYLPEWCRPLVSVPVLREFAAWNLALALERR